MIARDDFEKALREETIRLNLLDVTNGLYEFLAGNRLASFSYFLGGLRGKRILDIGCGAKPRDDYSRRLYGEEYEPHFCRVAKRMGVDVVGVDPRIDPRDEEFEAHRASTYTLPEFPQESFDGVLTSIFWNDPGFKNGDGLRNHQLETYDRVKRLLKQGGVSLNVTNEDRGARDDKQSRILTPEDFIRLGYEIVCYSLEGKSHSDDIIVLRKPLVVVA